MITAIILSVLLVSFTSAIHFEARILRTRFRTTFTIRPRLFSLGFGDIVPRGAIRLVTGIEVLNGLLLIAWSGSFVFILMQRYWKIDGSTTHHRSTH